MIMHTQMQLHSADQGWIRSSACNPRNNCIEVRLGGELVGVRDSKEGGKEKLIFKRPQWATFLSVFGSVKL
jgi:hypothetical protein